MYRHISYTIYSVSNLEDRYGVRRHMVPLSLSNAKYKYTHFLVDSTKVKKTKNVNEQSVIHGKCMWRQNERLSVMCTAHTHNHVLSSRKVTPHTEVSKHVLMHCSSDYFTTFSFVWCLTNDAQSLVGTSISHRYLLPQPPQTPNS